MPETVRSALYLDFDNVFSGLLKLDPKLALRFADEPAAWVSRLTAELLNGAERRWLVLRCYMNPSGSVPHPEGDGRPRLHFSKFRDPFTDAGFEVVDCPRLTHTKNGADIRLVLDAAEALRADVRYDEFVIASGDSDMTPLLLRLRSADRRVTVVSPSDSAVVLGAIADRLIAGGELLELLQSPSTEPELDPSALGSVVFDRAPHASASNGEDASLEDPGARSTFEKFVGERYAAAKDALNLATLAHEVRAQTGTACAETRWFGHGTFTRAVQALDLPSARMSQQHLWDSSRHSPPGPTEAAVSQPPASEAVARVTAALRLPRLRQEAWAPIYGSLADFVSAYEFSLTEATKWARDRLVEQDVEVSRRAITVVAQGASYGGCPLYRQPAPTAEEIGNAFVDNVLDRAAAADIELSDLDAAEVRSWFAPQSGEHD